MSEHIPLLRIASHLNTTNVYTKRNIIKDNISNIELLFKNKDLKTMPSAVFKQLMNEKKQQKSILAILDKQIFDIEQGAFQFGAP